MDVTSWFLLLVFAVSGVNLALVAAGTPGWWRLAVLWAATSALSVAVGVAVTMVDGSAAMYFVLTTVTCVAAAIVVTRRSVVPAVQRVRSLPAALAASLLGAATPVMAIYALLAMLFMGDGVGPAD